MLILNVYIYGTNDAHELHRHYTSLANILHAEESRCVEGYAREVINR